MHLMSNCSSSGQDVSDFFLTRQSLFRFPQSSFWKSQEPHSSFLAPSSRPPFRTPPAGPALISRAAVSLKAFPPFYEFTPTWWFIPSVSKLYCPFPASPRTFLLCGYVSAALFPCPTLGTFSARIPSSPTIVRNFLPRSFPLHAQPAAAIVVLKPCSE